MSDAIHVLRVYRQKYAISAADFAKKLGIAEVTLRSLENGTRGITAERVKEIVIATDNEITAHELMPEIFPAGFEFPPEQQSAVA